MSGASRKRALSDDSQSAADTAKMRKDDGQTLREIEPFDSIDEVTSAFSSIKNYVAPVKGDEFQNILERLEESDTIVRVKQGQDVAPDPELRFHDKEDITELRNLFAEYGSNAGKAKFEEQLAKMGSDDRLIRKQTNHRENSNHESEDVFILEQDEPLQHENREEIGVAVDKAANLCLIDPLKEERLDNDDDVEVIEDINGIQKDVPSDPKEEQVEAAEQPNAPEADEAGPDYAVEVDKARLCFIDPLKEELLDNYDEVVAMEGVDGMQHDSVFDPNQKQVQPIAATLNVPEPDGVEPDDALMALIDGSISEEDPEQIDSDESHASDGEDDEEPLPVDSERSDYVPYKKPIRRSSAISIPDKQMSNLSQDDTKVLQLSRLSHGELIDIIRNHKNHLKCPAYTAVLAKNERHLLYICVKAIDKPVTFSIHKNGHARSRRSTFSGHINDEVFLNGGDEYGDQLASLIATLLCSYEVSVSTTRLNFEAHGLGGLSVPFEKYFAQSSSRINISSLHLNNCELAPILRFVCPEELFVGMPCAGLFDEDGELISNDLPYLVLHGDHIDNVDKLMEQWQSGYISMGENCAWSDDSIKKVLTMWADEDGAVIRTVRCCYFLSDASVKPHQRTYTQWKTVFDEFRSSSTAANLIKFPRFVYPKVVFQSGC